MNVGQPRSWERDEQGVNVRPTVFVFPPDMQLGSVGTPSAAEYILKYLTWLNASVSPLPFFRQRPPRSSGEVARDGHLNGQRSAVREFHDFKTTI